MFVDSVATQFEKTKQKKQTDVTKGKEHNPRSSWAQSFKKKSERKKKTPLQGRFRKKNLPPPTRWRTDRLCGTLPGHLETASVQPGHCSVRAEQVRTG